MSRNTELGPSGNCGWRACTTHGKRAEGRGCDLLERDGLTQSDPRVAARSKWSRIEALLRNRAFRDAYIAARESFVAGVRDVIFPAGTYWLRRFVQATCAPGPVPG